LHSVNSQKKMNKTCQGFLHRTIITAF